MEVTIRQVAARSCALYMCGKVAAFSGRSPAFAVQVNKYELSQSATPPRSPVSQSSRREVKDKGQRGAAADHTDGTGSPLDC